MRIAAPGTSWISWWGAGMVLAVCLLASLPLGVRAQDEAGREATDTATRYGRPLPEHHRGRVYARQGLRHRQDQAGQPQHQLLRAVPVHEPDAWRPDVHRPPGPGAAGQGAQRPELAPDFRLAHRASSTTPKFRYNITPLVAAHDAADAALRQPPVPVQPGARARRRHRAQSYGPLGAGLLALLGQQRPADGGGLLSRRVLVRRLPHRRSPSTDSSTPSRSTPTSASSARPRPTTRATWRTARASSGGRPPASSVPATGSGDLEYHDEAGHAVRHVGRPQPRVALQLGRPRRPTPPRSSSPTAQPVRCRRAGRRGDGARSSTTTSSPSTPASSTAASRSRASTTCGSSPTSWPTARVPAGRHRGPRVPGPGDAHGRADAWWACTARTGKCSTTSSGSPGRFPEG